MNNNKTFPVHHFKCTRKQYDLVISQLNIYNKHSQDFVKHLIASTLLQIKKYPDGFIPIHSLKFIQKHFRNAQIKLLEDNEIITINHSYCRKECSKLYKVNEELIAPFSEFVTSKEYLTSPKINLITGKAMRTPLKSKYSDESKHPYCQKIVDAVKSIEFCIVNIKAIDQHLNNSKGQKHFLNDLNCRNAILDQISKEFSEDLIKYPPAYRVIKTGRITEMKGGMQSCTRKMKAMAWNGIPNLHNYDLKSSQAVILASELEKANIEHDWLNKYILDHNFKDIIINSLEIDKDILKACFFALIMGASDEKYRISLKKSENEKIPNSIFEKLGRDENKFDAFLEVTKELRKSLEDWYKWLKKVYVPNHCSTKYMVKNQVGMNFYAKKSEYDVRKLAAHLLQGFEAAFIFELQIVSKFYDYKVISNQHDGLVTIGEIPAKAISDAQQTSKIVHNGFALVKKTFE